MKNISIKHFISLLIISVFSLLTLIQNVSFAAGTIYFEPSSLSIKNGSIINIKVLANSTDFVAGQIDVSYDPSVLQYLSTSDANSVLPNSFGPEPSNGQIKLTLYTTKGPASGTNLQLVSFSFKAIKDNVDTSLKFISSTSLNYQDAKVASGSNQCNIKISSSATTASSPNTSGTSPGSTSSTANATQPPTSIPTNSQQKPQVLPTVIDPSSDNTAPKISSIAPIGFADGIVSIKIVTDEPTIATVKYGEKDKLLNSKNTVEYSNSYYVPLSEVAGSFSQDKSYYFEATVTDAAGNQTQSKVLELVVKPVNLTVTAQDENGAILANTKVIINGKEFTTDENGLVTIENVLPGTVAISIVRDGKTIYIGEVTAVKGVKNQSVIVTPNEIIVTTKTPLLNYVVPTIVAILGIAAVVIIVKKIKNRSSTQPIGAYSHPVQPWDPTANIKTSQHNITQQPARPTSAQMPNNQPPVPNYPSSPSPTNSGTIITPTANAPAPAAEPETQQPQANNQTPTPQPQNNNSQNPPQPPAQQ